MLEVLAPSVVHCSSYHYCIYHYCKNCFFLPHYMYVLLQCLYGASHIKMESLFLYFLILRLANSLAMTNGTVSV